MAGKNRNDNQPQITEVRPTAAIPGGEFQIKGIALAAAGRPRVLIGDREAPVLVGSRSFVVARVPEGAAVGELTVDNGLESSRPQPCEIGIQIAENLHPVANPAVDQAGNIFTTFSGSRGQKTPVAVYKIDLNYAVKPFISDLMNATALAFDHDGLLYISSRYDGVVYQSAPNGNLAVYVEGMGVATGIAFDTEDNLYVGDRSGTIFKISRDRQIYVFATLEPSIAAYHLAFGPDGDLYVTGPTTSTNDCIYRISKDGEVSVFYRGFGRPQGLAFDADGRLYIAASKGGRRGIFRFENHEPELFLSGPNIVGLAFTPQKSMVITTTGALYRVDVDIRGLPLPPR